MTANATISRPIAIACLTLSMLLVGSYVALTKPLTLILPVFLLAWLRFGMGGLAMLHWLKKPIDEPQMSPQKRTEKESIELDTNLLKITSSKTPQQHHKSTIIEAFLYSWHRSSIWLPT